MSLSSIVMLLPAAELTVETGIHAQAGNVRGVELLLRSGAGGPGTIQVRRQTNGPANGETVPAACVLKLVDPDGRTVAVIDATEQAAGSVEHPLRPPAGAAGRWRVVVAGGRNDDRIRFRFEAPPAWGVRGCLALEPGAGVPNPGFVFVPRTAKRLIVEQFGGTNGSVTLRNEGGTALGSPTGSPRRLFNQTITPGASGSVVQLAWQSSAGLAFACDGFPGLLCPSAAMARDLAGGTVEQDGRLLAGPLQARIRAWQTTVNPASLAVTLNFPSSVPGNLAHPLNEALFYGKYGPLSGLRSALDKQIIDPANEWFGTVNLPGGVDTWQDFLAPGVFSVSDAGGFAAAAGVPGTLNPAFGNAALRRRAAAHAFSHLIRMSGEDLLREGDLAQGPYPITHAFFTYPDGLASGLLTIDASLDAETRNLWREGLMAVGDRLADYRAYQSNQWMHVLLGHLRTHVITGEPRFRRYFERGMAASVGGADGAAAKYGQHPAGFFLEEYGCDGNYDHLSTYVLATAWHLYRDLPGRDQGLVTAMAQAVTRNQRFKSFFHLQEPGGAFVCPTAHNSRTDHPLTLVSYPGDLLLRRDDPVAAARWAAPPAPAQGSGEGATYPQLINTAAWARQHLAAQLPGRDTGYALNQAAGGWTPELMSVWTRSDSVTPAQLPIRAIADTWELPGLLAWRRSLGYSLIFHDIAGGRRNPAPPGWRGGCLTAFWTPDCGMVLSSMRNSVAGAVGTADTVTHGCVYVPNGAVVTASGQESSNVTWDEAQRRVRIVADASTLPTAFGGNRALTWTHELRDDEQRLSVSLRAGSAGTLSLPLREVQGSLTASLDNGAVVLRRGNHWVRFAASDGAAATLTGVLATSRERIRAARWSVAGDGTPRTIIITSSSVTGRRVELRWLGEGLPGGSWLAQRLPAHGEPAVTTPAASGAWTGPFPVLGTRRDQTFTALVGSVN